jgi:hypothetical protein
VAAALAELWPEGSALVFDIDWPMLSLRSDETGLTAREPAS